VTWTQPWLDVTPTSGSLAVGSTTAVNASINALANSLPGGVYNDTLLVTNTSSGIEHRRDIVLTVVQVATIPFYEGFETGTLATYWYSTGTNAYRTEVTSNHLPHSGSYHLTMDTSISGTYSRNELTLVIDLADYENVVLSFWMKDFSDSSDGPPPTPFIGGADFDGVAISEDGNTWYEVQGLRSGDGVSEIYTQFIVDLDAAIATYGLAYNSTFRIRFNHYDNYPLVRDGATDGFAFDDIEITGQVLDDLRVVPRTRFTASGEAGGPFSPASMTYTLTNVSSAPLDWTASKTANWLDLSNTGGTLAPGAWDTVEVSVNALADSLPGGIHNDILLVTNTSSGIEHWRDVVLTILHAATIPFYEGFETGTLATYWHSTGTNEYRTQVTSDYFPHSGTYHLTMDDSVDTNLDSRNELTLVVDLADH